MLPPRYTHTLKVEITSHVPIAKDKIELAVWKGTDERFQNANIESPLRDCKVENVVRTEVRDNV